MKALQAYFSGWSSVFRNKRMWLLVYIVNFALAFLAAWPVSGFLGKTVRYSMSLERSLPEFDYTFLAEMQKKFGNQINAILDQTTLFIIIFLLLSVFMTGGILNIFKKGEEMFRLKTFWKGCSKYFWRILRLTIYFLAIHGIILFLFFLVFKSWCSGLNPFEMESEKELIDAFMFLSPLYILVFTIIAMVQDYAKIHMVHENPTILLNTFWASFKLVFSDIGKFSFLYFLNILTLGIAFGIYYLLSNQFEGITMTSIMILFVIGQLFIIARIAIKLLNLASATYLYKWTRKGYIK